jgi:head-tail adaptor
MNGSDLREWIALFQMELVPDGQGGSREAVPAGLVADLPANVATPRGYDRPAGDQLGSRVRHEITIRYQPGVTSVYRVMWRNQLLDIVGEPENIDACDTWLKLVCERKEAGAQ